MNIAFIGTYTEKKVNGVSTSVSLLTRELALKGHRIFFYQLGKGIEDEERYSDGDIVIRKFPHRSLIGTYRSLLKVLKENEDQIDIFSIHSVFIPANILFAKVIKRLGFKYILTPHGGYNINILKRRPLKKFLFYHIFEKQLINQADGIVCVSNRELKDISHLNSRKKPAVINNSISDKEIVVNKKERSGTILYLGRFDIYHKGLDILLKIFSVIERLDPQLSLKLYGEGPDLNKLHKLRQKLKLNRCSIHPPVFGEEKAGIISDASIYIQASRWEAFGIPIFESMLSLTPVVVSGHCYVSDLIRSNDFGLILHSDPETAARQIIDYFRDETHKRQACRRAQQFVRNQLSPSVISEETIKYYTEVIHTEVTEWKNIT